MLKTTRLGYLLVVVVVLQLDWYATNVQCMIQSKFLSSVAKQDQRDKFMYATLNLIEMKLRNEDSQFVNDRDLEVLGLLLFEISKRRSREPAVPSPVYWYLRQGR